MKVIYYGLNTVILAGLMMILVLLVLTPEKTKYGTYTDIIKYWTSNEYLEANFKG